MRARAVKRLVVQIVKGTIILFHFILIIVAAVKHHRINGTLFAGATVSKLELWSLNDKRDHGGLLFPGPAGHEVLWWNPPALDNGGG